MNSIAQVTRPAREITRTTVLFWSLVTICVLVRLLLWFNYKPIVYNDTPLYLDLASYIRHLDFQGYQGERTPGYLLLLLLSGLNYQIVWLVQSVLGISISLMLYLIAKHQTESVGLAFIIGLAHTLSINQVFFEASLLTETLTTFLVVLSLLLLVWRHHARPENTIYYDLALGLVIAWGF
jgi:hypothetical protein